jgi:hypothetical protein
MSALASERGMTAVNDALLQRFERARDAASRHAATIVFAFSLSGIPTLLRVTGPALAERLIRPFRHLETDLAALREPALAIDAWSEAETGIAPPRDIPEGHPPHSIDGRLAYRNQPGGRAVADRRQGRIIACFDAAERLSYSDVAKPFRSLLIPLLHDRGRQLLHGGLIAASSDAPALLLAGRSGSGKSTVALAALAAGFRFLGDDHTCLELAEKAAIGHSLYATCGIEPGHLGRFTQLPGDAVATPDGAKSVVYLAPRALHRLDRAARIAAIVIPEIRPGGVTETRPTSRGDALRALMPGSISILVAAPETRESPQFNGIGALVERLPAYRLALGPDLAAIAPVLRRLSAALAAEGAGR